MPPTRPQSSQPDRPARPFVSVVIPCYNEEESIPVLHERLTKVLSRVTDHHEIVLCNDGSRDGTIDAIRALVAADPAVRGIDLSRNFGHQMCLTAGLDAARGQVIVMMDADLQDPPELLPKMIKLWREGADVVYAVRKKRLGEGLFKRATAAIFYRILRAMTKISIPVDTGDFRLIDRRALDSILSLRESNRFLRGLFTWVGFRQVPVHYVRQERYAGETKYPLRKMVRFAFDGITSFSAAPLQIAIWLGLISATMAFIYGLRVFYQGWMGYTVPGWASTTVSVLFLGGIQLLTIGLLGEYIGRIFDEVKRRPLYLVREIIEHAPTNGTHGAAHPTPEPTAAKEHP